MLYIRAFLWILLSSFFSLSSYLSSFLFTSMMPRRRSSPPLFLYFSLLSTLCLLIFSFPLLSPPPLGFQHVLPCLHTAAISPTSLPPAIVSPFINLDVPNRNRPMFLNFLPLCLIFVFSTLRHFDSTLKLCFFRFGPDCFDQSEKGCSNASRLSQDVRIWK